MPQLDLPLILHLYKKNMSMKHEKSSVVKKHNMEVLLKYLKLN